MSTDGSVRGQFTGRHMWLVAIGFFGVIIAVNVTMAVLSYRSWTGLAVENSYVASQEFETKRLAHEAQRHAGWVASLTHAGGTVSLDVRDATGAAVALGDVTIEINRPVGGHDDQTVTLAAGSDGSYAAQVELAAGVWEITAIAPATPLGFFERRERITVAGSSP